MQLHCLAGDLDPLVTNARPWRRPVASPPGTRWPGPPPPCQPAGATPRATTIIGARVFDGLEGPNRRRTGGAPSRTTRWRPASPQRASRGLSQPQRAGDGGDQRSCPCRLERQHPATGASSAEISASDRVCRTSTHRLRHLVSPVGRGRALPATTKFRSAPAASGTEIRRPMTFRRRAELEPVQHHGGPGSPARYPRVSSSRDARCPAASDRRRRRRWPAAGARPISSRITAVSAKPPAPHRTPRALRPVPQASASRQPPPFLAGHRPPARPTVARRNSLQFRDLSSSHTRLAGGSFQTRSAMMVRWISLAPPGWSLQEPMKSSIQAPDSSRWTSVWPPGCAPAAHRSRSQSPSSRCSSSL